MHHEFSLAYLSVFGLAPPDMITLALVRVTTTSDCDSIRSPR